MPPPQATPWLRRVAGTLLDLVYPQECVACRAGLTAPSAGCLCARCFSGMPLIDAWQCPRCGEQLGPYAQVSRRACPSCRDRPGLLFRKAVAACRYEGVAREMVHRFKYSGDVRAVEWMGLRMAEKLRHAGWIGQVDLLVPVPLHWTRRLSRRFNQSELLGRVVARECSRPMVPRLLRRRRRTSAQSLLETAERMENVRGAFQVTRPRLARDRSILLIDDVMTTCATATECTRVLLEAGAKRVYVAVFAR